MNQKHFKSLLILLFLSICVEVLANGKLIPFVESSISSDEGKEFVFNNPPVVDAGVGKGITLPTNSLHILGTASDTDGSIVSYLWTKVSGPAATLNGANTLLLNPSGLVAGIYIFRLTVIDDLGAFASDDMQLTVNPAPVGDSQAPATITNLSATVLSSSSIRLSWTAPGDDGTTGTATVYDIRYSKTPIIIGNFTSGGYPSGVPQPSVAGTTQTITIAGLEPNTTYYFAIVARDDVGNQSALSNVPSAQTQSGPPSTVDTQPPATIANLTATVLSSSSIKLSWTAPGDDGMTGTATIYDIRYSKTPFSIGNFGSGLYPGVPVPAIAGTTQTQTVTELEQNTTYYFAMVARDEAGNQSALSNVPSAKTPALIFTVDVGSDVWLTLPLNSKVLSGSASISEGTIVSYQWTKQSGPSATLSNENSATLSISEIEYGPYVFRLTVTSDAGAIAYDEVTLNFCPASRDFKTLGKVYTPNSGVETGPNIPTNGGANFAALAKDDTHNILYVGTTQGIWIYNANTKTSRIITINTSVNGDKLCSAHLLSLYIDEINEILYVGTLAASPTTGNFWRYDTKTNTGKTFIQGVIPGNGDPFPGGLVFESRKIGSKVIISIVGLPNDGGIYIYDEATQTGKHLGVNTTKAGGIHQVIGDYMPTGECISTAYTVYNNKEYLFSSIQPQGIWEYNMTDNVARTLSVANTRPGGLHPVIGDPYGDYPLDWCEAYALRVVGTKLYAITYQTGLWIYDFPTNTAKKFTLATTKPGGKYQVCGDPFPDETKSTARGFDYDYTRDIFYVAREGGPGQGGIWEYNVKTNEAKLYGATDEGTTRLNPNTSTVCKDEKNNIVYGTSFGSETNNGLQEIQFIEEISLQDLAKANFKTRASGNWGDYSTWQVQKGEIFINARPGYLPGPGNAVFLEAGHSISLRENASCKDLHMNSHADTVRLNTKENVLDVWGKLRLYSGAAPGASNANGVIGTPGWINTGTNGRIRLKGNTNRVITEKDEFSDHINMKGWTLECDFANDNVRGMLHSSFRANDVIVTSGSLEVKGEQFKLGSN